MSEDSISLKKKLKSDISQKGSIISGSTSVDIENKVGKVAI